MIKSKSKVVSICDNGHSNGIYDFFYLDRKHEQIYTTFYCYELFDPNDGCNTSFQKEP